MRFSGEAPELWTNVILAAAVTSTKRAGRRPCGRRLTRQDGRGGHRRPDTSTRRATASLEAAHLLDDELGVELLALRSRKRGPELLGLHGMPEREPVRALAHQHLREIAMGGAAVRIHLQGILERGRGLDELSSLQSNETRLDVEGHLQLLQRRRGLLRESAWATNVSCWSARSSEPRVRYALASMMWRSGKDGAIWTPCSRTVMA